MRKQKEELSKKLETYKQLINYNKRREEAKVQQQVLTQSLVIDTRCKKAAGKLAPLKQVVSPLKRVMGPTKCFDDSWSVNSEPEHRGRLHLSMLETAPTEHMSSTCSVSSLETRDPTKVHLPFVIFSPKDCLAKLEFVNEPGAPESAFNFLGKRSLHISSSTPQELVEDHHLISSVL